MKLQFYNTLNRRKEEFTPIQKQQVGLYTCGPTVYNFAHIGNLRTYIFEDILKRVLLYNGYRVKHIMNITDVGHLTGDRDMGEDKMEKGSQREGKTAWEVAEFYTLAFKNDIKQLNIIEPDTWVKATDTIEDQIALIKTLQDKGYTYQTADGIYFDTSRFKDYTKLSHQDLESLQEGARVEKNPEKRNATDFALWKFSPADVRRQMEWDSPWGSGFPGWHIECSAMSSTLLGTTFDIHGGGRDLIFPHHENEIAQSEGASGKPFVKYWLHNGFVNVNQEKMSKSLGNFFTIRDILKSYDPEVVRFFILTAHYRSPIDFSDQNLNDAQAGLSRFYEALQAADTAVEGCPEGGVPGPEATALEAQFRAAMDDDFNTAQAIGHLFEGARTINRLIAEKKFRKQADKVASVRAVRQKIAELGDVLGLFASEPAYWLKQKNLKGLQALGLTEADVEALIDERLAARSNKDFARADQIRDNLAAQGVELLDAPTGTTWKTR
jgi:cysteinyl-tRNA synthetase